MASVPDLHQEALIRLCFACARVFKPKERRHEVEKNLDMISKAFDFRSGIFTIDGVTPISLCNSCHLYLRKVSSGKIICAGRKLIDWQECGNNCTTCSYLETRKCGGAYKRVSGQLSLKSSI